MKKQLDEHINKNAQKKQIIVRDNYLKIENFEFNSLKKIGVSVPFFQRGMHYDFGSPTDSIQLGKYRKLNWKFPCRFCKTEILNPKTLYVNYCDEKCKQNYLKSYRRSYSKSQYIKKK